MSITRAVPVLILVLFGLAAVFVPETTPAVTGGPVDSGDTAWLLTAIFGMEAWSLDPASCWT